MKLTKLARETIKGREYLSPTGWRRVTIAGYMREQGYTSGWGGDRCGCPDDRCIGFHHYDETDCGCLDVLLDQYVAKLFIETTTVAGS